MSGNLVEIKTAVAQLIELKDSDRESFENEINNGALELIQDALNQID